MSPDVLRAQVKRGFGIFTTSHIACLPGRRLTVYSYSLSATGSLPMIPRNDPLEAAALERFMRATRAVNAAFDATRGESDFIQDGQSVARSLERLDAALHELETSEQSLDAILSRRAGH
jgi:hypothetical protein